MFERGRGISKIKSHNTQLTILCFHKEIKQYTVKAVQVSN